MFVLRRALPPFRRVSRRQSRRAHGRVPDALQESVSKRRSLLAFGAAGAIAAAFVVGLMLMREDSRGEVPRSPPVDEPEWTEPPSTAWSTDRPPTGLAVRTTPLLWHPVDERTAADKPPYDADWSEAGRALVDVTGLVSEAETWRVGQRMAFALPQLGEIYESTIERIDHGPGRSVSVRGLIPSADGKNRRVVVTAGPARVFAYIDTEQGSYELFGDRRLGWLLPSSSLKAGVHASPTDYVLPETEDEHVH